MNILSNNKLNNDKHTLLNNGYILLPNILSNDEINFGLSSIQNNNIVDYSILKQFIDKIFFHKIKKNSKVISDPYYVKFRFSNNNNSTDASTFHGDIYNNSDSELLPIYTCLCYFDDAQLEIIPGSHKYNNNGWSIENYNKKKILNVHRGDILIFHANLHHRGINYNKVGNRRLLQVFEVFPNKETYIKHHSKLFVVQSSESFIVKNLLNPILYQISKYPKIIDYITLIHYILMYNDLHYKIALIDISPYEKKNNYISYEPGRRVYFDNLINKKEDLNVNIVCDKKINSITYGNYYMYIYILYLFISLIIVYIVTKILYDYGVYKK
jgi:hypothetical protein